MNRVTDNEETHGWFHTIDLRTRIQKIGFTSLIIKWDECLNGPKEKGSFYQKRQRRQYNTLINVSTDLPQAATIN